MIGCVGFAVSCVGRITVTLLTMSVIDEPENDNFFK
jgi:hypothetical protein